MTHKSMWKFLLPVIIGIIFWLLTPIRPEAVSISGWHMLTIFIATIIGCILQPFPIGAISILGFTVAVVTGTLEIDTAIAGFGNPSIWLIAIAFFISRGFIKTGLGRRIALIFVRLFGKKTLGLAYSLLGVDLLLAPATPSNTARAGGIMFPIINALSRSFDSNPEDHTERKVGSYLTFTEFHANIITSAMFLTAMAGNPLAQSLAQSQNVHITWMNWFTAAIVPGIICLIAVPYIIYKIYPPEIKETPNARHWAEEELNTMGPLTRPEIYMAVAFITALVLWIFGSVLGIHATTAAFITLAILLITKVLEWNDILREKGAWDTLIWFSILVMMADQLNKLGFIPWLSKAISSSLGHFSWPVVLILLVLFYFYSHYLFASSTAHVSAMYAALLAVAISAGAPPLLAALLLGFFGNLMASTTHYSSGPAPILFSSGYVQQSDWWKMNALLAIFYIIIWAGLGSLWMKMIGIY